MHSDDRFDNDRQTAPPPAAPEPASTKPAEATEADVPPHKPVGVGCVFAAVGVRVADRSPAEYAAYLEEL